MRHLYDAEGALNSSVGVDCSPDSSTSSVMHSPCTDGTLRADGDCGVDGVEEDTSDVAHFPVAKLRTFTFVIQIYFFKFRFQMT